MLAPEGVETLLIGAGSLVTPVPETGVIMYPEAKAPRVYSVTIVVKSRILLKVVCRHDEVPLDASEIGLGAPGLQTLPSEFKSIAAGNVGGDASNVVVSLLPSARGLTIDDTSFSRLASYPGGSPRFRSGSSDGRGMVQCASRRRIRSYLEHHGQDLHYSLYGYQHAHALSNRIRCYRRTMNGIYSTDGQQG
jgi:hypothetical protein